MKTWERPLFFWPTRIELLEKIGYVSLIISCENILIIFAYQFCNMLHPGNVIQEFLYFCLKQTLTLDPESTKNRGYDFDHGKSWGTSEATCS